MDLENITQITESSKFGISNVGLEILEVIKEPGGFISVLMKTLADLPFTDRVMKFSSRYVESLKNIEKETQELLIRVLILLVRFDLPMPMIISLKI